MGDRGFGIIGLGVMGQNLALNVERNGYPVAGFDLDAAKLQATREIAEGKNVAVANTLQEFIDSLEKPRKILMMVPAGAAVDSVIGDLKSHLSEDDILIDGGNSYFEDTIRRAEELEGVLLYVGSGISGGEEGALWGPSIMPGGNDKAWPALRPILQGIAAKVEDGSPCCEWLGPGGAGHFVKMVHNGIEYADMQMICEAYFLMSRLLGLRPQEMATIFSQWNEGELNSYLIEITAKILTKQDAETGKPLIDIVLDTAGQKGTGKWTSKVALDLGIPAATIAEAVFARTISALKEERVAASSELAGPSVEFSGNRDEFVEKVRRTLYASKICSYAQGFQLLQGADAEYGWDLSFGDIALLWRAGCIIRAQFLDNIQQAFGAKPELANLLLDPYFKSAVEEGQEAWRAVVAKAVEAGIPTPAFSSALCYYDSYRAEVLPANLLQAQRDYFGAHTYERVDKPRRQFFHTDW